MPLVLCILDGWGIRSDKTDLNNPISSAQLPCYNNLIKNCYTTQLQASGIAVGLPPGQAGNSEVGHFTIGAGRRCKQSLPKIDEAIQSGEIKKNPAIIKLLNYHSSNHNAYCNIVGLMSDGGVHSHVNHIIYTVNLLNKQGIKTNLHLITDGRDSTTDSSIKYLQILTSSIEKLNSLCKISTISGRYYAMDRDKRWDRTKATVDVFRTPKTKNQFHNASDFLAIQHQNKITDEFIEPAASIEFDGIKNDDSIFIINFRADRIYQLLNNLIKDQYGPILTMCPCSPDIDQYTLVLFPTEQISNTLGMVLDYNGVKQLRIAETEKYAHVTFFLNCGRMEPYPDEERILIPSPKVDRYDTTPAMSADGVTNNLLNAIAQNKYQFICVNYANADMIGHTGNYEAAIRACETIDKCLAKLVNSCNIYGYDLIITADHGNIEQLHDEQSNNPHTAHTLNPVPFIHACKIQEVIYNATNNNLGLENIASTILNLLNIAIPSEMSEPLISISHCLNDNNDVGIEIDVALQS